MIPIRDRQGRIIGFGGRVLDGSQPKYINTSDTTIFHKSHVVYGLDMAYSAIREAQQVVIVEGYMDVIAAQQFGFTNVVACMGTALTPDQLRQLQRYTDNFVLALDADSAGQQATIRGLNQARQALGRVRKPTITPGGAVRLEDRLGANLFIASMPEGLDPDDVVRQNPTLWRELIANAKPLVDFYFSIVVQQVDLTSARGKGLAVAELAPLIAELDDEIEREHYVQQLSRLVQLDERTIVSRVLASAKTNQVTAQPRPNTGANRFGIHKRTAAVNGTERVGDAANLAPGRRTAADSLNPEEYLLANLLREPDLLIWLAGAAADHDIEPPQADDRQHVENQEVFRALKRFITSDEQWDIELFQDSLTGHLHGRLGQLMAIDAQLPACNGDELRNDMLKVLVRMRIHHLKANNMHVKYLIDEAQRTSDRDAARSFDTTNNRNLRELWHLQRILVDLSRVLFTQGRPEQGVKVR